MKNIYVGNLEFDVTEQQVRDLFAPHGEIQRVKLVLDRDTGRSRGFAFVEMSNDAEADAAIQALNGTPLGERQLSVNEARDKKDEGPSRGSDTMRNHRSHRL